MPVPISFWRGGRGGVRESYSSMASAIQVFWESWPGRAFREILIASNASDDSRQVGIPLWLS